MNFELTSPPDSEPITLSEAKLHIKIDHTDEDTEIDSLIALARRKVEHDARRQLITASFNLHLDEFPKTTKPIRITRPPVQQIGDISYYDTDGELQTLDAATYHADTKSTPARIVLRNNQHWPATEHRRPNAVTVGLTLGYGDSPGDVPAEAKHAIKLLLGHWYLNREAAAAGSVREIEFSYTALIRQLQWTAHDQIDLEL